MNARAATSGSTAGQRREVLAVIPARGGSKGLPRKNILDLGGLPLVAWSIRAALDAAMVTRVIVSTDDEEIARIAREHGAEAPFLRPQDLAGDRCNIMDAVNHTLNRLKQDEGYIPDFFCTLYPTHPFRTPGLVNELTRILVEKQHMVITAKRLRMSRRSHLVPDGEGYAFMDPGPAYEKAFRPYGLYEGKPLLPPRRGVYVHILDDPIELMDIDSARDLALANAVLQHGLFPKAAPSCA